MELQYPSLTAGLVSGVTIEDLPSVFAIPSLLIMLYNTSDLGRPPPP